jgi:hypothetical protein
MYSDIRRLTRANSRVCPEMCPRAGCGAGRESSKFRAQYYLDGWPSG